MNKACKEETLSSSAVYPSQNCFFESIIYLIHCFLIPRRSYASSPHACFGSNDHVKCCLVGVEALGPVPRHWRRCCVFRGLSFLPPHPPGQSPSQLKGTKESNEQGNARHTLAQTGTLACHRSGLQRWKYSLTFLRTNVQIVLLILFTFFLSSKVIIN